MKKWILVLCLLLCACRLPGSPDPQKYEVILLDGSIIYPQDYCELYADTYIIVKCKSLDSIYWDNVYVAKEVHRITEGAE